MSDNKMMVKIMDLGWFCGGRTKESETLNNYLVSNRGKWIEVDTSQLFDDQYNTVDGVRVFDYHISEIMNDKRSNPCTFKTWRGVKPLILPTSGSCKKLEFKNNYQLENVNGLYLRFNSYYNNKPTLEFIVDQGKLWESNGIGYKMLSKKDLSKYITKTGIAEFIKLFNLTY